MPNNRKPLGIQAMRDMAAARGGQCLSEEYKNTNGKLEWKCANPEHKPWAATADHVKRGSWCRECRGLKKKTLDDMKKLAAEKGGDCLSEVYESGAKKLDWLCAAGHTWSARGYAVTSGQWCPKCFNECGRGHRKNANI